MGLKKYWPALALFMMTTVLAEPATIGGVDVEIMRSSDNPAPLVLFSHGAGSCPDRYQQLLSKLANSGYTVMAVKHKDCISGDTTPDVSWRSPEQWSDATNSYRRDDMHALLDALPGSDYAQYISSFDSVGCMGHSMGGYTCMGLAGAWASWQRTEVKAIAVLSPWHKPYTVQQSAVEISGVSVLYQGGTKDRPITPDLVAANGAYEQTNSPKYLQVFNRARHGAWSDSRLGRRFHDEMSYYQIAFFDAYLKGESVKKLEVKKGRVDTLRFAHQQ